jgi:dTDP-glucose 4,6-dehydratase
MVLITGGAGFIGSNFVLEWMMNSRGPIINLDKLTYASSSENTLSNAQSDHSHFVYGDIADRHTVTRLLALHNPIAVIHLAAETHVDRSISSPTEFIQANVVGTFELLEAIKMYWVNLPLARKEMFRFLHVSTDEVFGSLDVSAPPSTELSPYAPNNPYAATKAASDHLVRAYYRTYGLPTLTIHSSNGFGPFQFPEKLIPMTITNALSGKPIPIYGNGRNTRQWMFVEDQCAAIRATLEFGKVGETYNVGGTKEIENRMVVETICKILDQQKPRLDRRSYRTQIVYVQDRPGHDQRYALDSRKVKDALGWTPQETFETGIAKTIDWYLTHLPSATSLQ